MSAKTHARPTPAEDLEDLHRRVSCNLALLIRYMQAEQTCNRGGTTIELEQDAWSAVETMLLDARAGLDRLFTQAEGVDPKTVPDLERFR